MAEWGEPKHKAPLAYDEEENKQPSKKELKEMEKEFREELLTGQGDFGDTPTKRKVETIFDSRAGYKKSLFKGEDDGEAE